MSLDLTGISNFNEYYSNHYFATEFATTAKDTLDYWRKQQQETPAWRTPWARLREVAQRFYVLYAQAQRLRVSEQRLEVIRELADLYLYALDYPAQEPRLKQVHETLQVPVYREIIKANGAPLLWVVLADESSENDESDIFEGHAFAGYVEASAAQSSTPLPHQDQLPMEALISKVFFSVDPPRWLLVIGLQQIALVDRNKWNEKRYIRFELEDIFARREESTLQAVAVLLHRSSLCPAEGTSLLDTLGEESFKHATAVSQDLKYALRECVELLGNEASTTCKTATTPAPP